MATIHNFIRAPAKKDNGEEEDEDEGGTREAEAEAKVEDERCCCSVLEHPVLLLQSPVLPPPLTFLWLIDSVVNVGGDEEC